MTINNTQKDAVTSENELGKRISFDDNNSVNKFSEILSVIPWDQTTIFCVGTDRSTGDSFGPIIGSKLSDMNLGIPVMGTLNDPIHAVNLFENVTQIKTPYTLAIDACLGKFDHVGHLIFENTPLRPGAGVGKKLPEVGNWCITGVVNVSGFMEYFVLQNTRLSIVMQMSDIVTKSISQSVKKFNNQITNNVSHLKVVKG